MATTHPSVAAAGLLASLLAACATPHAIDVPDKLRPAAGESLAMIVPAQGVQIYTCSAAAGAAATHEWVFVAPQAELFDTRGKAIGWHGEGPRWQANDGSTVVGTVQHRADAPVAGTIPWLLLGAKTSGPQGVFSGVSSIQRVNTAGGAAPATDCGPETAGHRARVSYTADYYFYRNTP